MVLKLVAELHTQCKKINQVTQLVENTQIRRTCNQYKHMKVDAVGKFVFPFSPFLRQEQAPFTLNGTSLQKRHLEIFICLSGHNQTVTTSTSFLLLESDVCTETTTTRQRIRQSATNDTPATCKKKCEEPSSKTARLSTAHEQSTVRRNVGETSTHEDPVETKSVTHKQSSPHREGCAHSPPSLFLIIGGPAK